ncbi:hypothetical protein BgiMline_014122, partial [Biomphalaria glabrata]
HLDMELPILFPVDYTTERLCREEWVKICSSQSRDGLHNYSRMKSEAGGEEAEKKGRKRTIFNCELLTNGIPCLRTEPISN